MTDAAEPKEEGLIVTVGQGFDPVRDLWMVIGPYWDDGQPGASQGAFDVAIEGREEAMEYASETAALHPGCKVRVHERPA